VLLIHSQVVTDVEGSTQLWEWDAEVMGEAVELHNSVIRGIMEEHGGHEVGFRVWFGLASTHLRQLAMMDC
jgi:hypothetical protein